MFPFFIKKQQEKLQQYSKFVANKKLTCEQSTTVIGVRTALENANHAYSVYLLNTRSSFGGFLSIIPGTSAFQSRLIAGRHISIAFEMLKKQDALIKVAPTNNPIKRSQSTGDIPALPTNYASPIKRSISADNTPVGTPDKKVNHTTTIRPTFT
jgi:hypothetical protein